MYTRSLHRTRSPSGIRIRRQMGPCLQVLIELIPIWNPYRTRMGPIYCPWQCWQTNKADGPKNESRR